MPHEVLSLGLDELLVDIMVINNLLDKKKLSKDEEGLLGEWERNLIDKLDKEGYN